MLSFVTISLKFIPPPLSESFYQRSVFRDSFYFIDFFLSLICFEEFGKSNFYGLKIPDLFFLFIPPFLPLAYIKFPLFQMNFQQFDIIENYPLV